MAAAAERVLIPGPAGSIEADISDPAHPAAASR
jgi:hypothetical protein